jgi:hypothetical protein
MSLVSSGNDLGDHDSMVFRYDNLSMAACRC